MHIYWDDFRCRSHLEWPQPVAVLFDSLRSSHRLSSMLLPLAPAVRVNMATCHGTAWCSLVQLGSHRKDWTWSCRWLMGQASWSCYQKCINAVNHQSFLRQIHADLLMIKYDLYHQHQHTATPATPPMSLLPISQSRCAGLTPVLLVPALQSTRFPILEQQNDMQCLVDSVGYLGFWCG